MTGKRPKGNLVGLFGFAQQWVDVCKRLITEKTRQLTEENKETLDLSYAPDGAYRAIVTIESGTAFVTIAKRAIENNRQFERSSFTRPVLDAELEPFGKKTADLSPDGRGRAVKRINKSISGLMHTFEFFGLFEPINKQQHTYRLTDLGVSIYEALSEASEEEEPVAVGASGGLQFVGRYRGVGTTRGGYTQVTLHRYY